MKIVKNTKLKTTSTFVAAFALVAWAVSSAIQTGQNSTLIDKNADLIHLVDVLEGQNEALNDRLECWQRVRDRHDDAIGRGLAAVANEDSAELARQAQILIEIANEEQCT